MGTVELSLWLDQRWYDALKEHLEESPEAVLNEYLGKLIDQLPANVYDRISGEIRAEDLRREQEREAARRFSVFHVTENGSDSHFLLERDGNILYAARWLRDYLRRENSYDSRFGNQFSYAVPLTAEQFHAYASERMDNTGRVTGAFEIDLDKGEFAALHIMDGWKVYRVKDVSAAVCHAYKKQGLDSDRRLERFLEKLEGKELTHGPVEPEETCGVRRLCKEDVVFTGEISEVDSLLNFSLYCAFNVDEVFGTHVETSENNDYLNVYANYDMTAGRACDRLEITLCHGDGTDKYLCYKLDDAERGMLESRMEGYCCEQTGMGLKEYSAQHMAGEQEQGGMQSQQM